MRYAALRSLSARRARRGAALLTACAALILAACSDATGPEGVGQANVVLSSDRAAAHRAPASDVRLSAGSLGDVPVSAVGSLTLEVTRIDVHVAGGDDEASGEGEEGPGDEDGEEGGSGWVTLELSVATPIDLLDLGATGSVQLASGAVPAGKITQVRLFFDASELVLDADIDASGQQIPAGAYQVNVPSAEQTGLKIPGLAVDISDGETETVTLEIGVDASIGTLVWTANGFQLSPVLRVK